MNRRTFEILYAKHAADAIREASALPDGSSVKLARLADFEALSRASTKEALCAMFVDHEDEPDQVAVVVDPAAEGPEELSDLGDRGAAEV